jgi:hypothetical protein
MSVVLRPTTQKRVESGYQLTGGKAAAGSENSTGFTSARGNAGP